MTIVQLSVSQILASFVMLTAGTAYAFSLYGPQLSTLFQLSQSETAFIASFVLIVVDRYRCGNAGFYFSGPISGTLVDRFPNFTYLIFLVGGLGLFSGYQLVSLTVSGVLPRPHYLVLALYFFIVGLGSSANYHCSLATDYRNWPAPYRSIAVGISVGFFGLSAFFFATIGSIFFVHNDILYVEQFLSFLGIFCLVISLLSAVLLRPIPPDTEIVQPPVLQVEQELEHAAAIVETDTNSITSNGYVAILKPLEPQLEIAMDSVSLQNTENESENNESENGKEQGENCPEHPPPSATNNLEDDVPCFPSIKSFLLAYNMFAIIGVGLMYINNVGIILIALLPADMDSRHPNVQSMQKSHVQLLSILSFVSRVVVGILSDECASYIGLPRTFWPITGALFMIIGCGMMLYIKNSDVLYVVTGIVGWAYGTIWSSIPILVGEYFGKTNFARNWGWMCVVPAIGGYVFAAIFGSVYEQSGVKLCKGQNCYMASFIAATIVSFVALIGNAYLYYKRYRETRV
ncbi:major facilitator superfamily domain-containing protein [Globomyces pollinis-pini]|nr:major facilitator superfamily domain-containing protein [Globomyces pollinis-pini]